MWWSSLATAVCTHTYTECNFCWQHEQTSSFQALMTILSLPLLNHPLYLYTVIHIIGSWQANIEWVLTGIPPPSEIIIALISSCHITVCNVAFVIQTLLLSCRKMVLRNTSDCACPGWWWLCMHTLIQNFTSAGVWKMWTQLFYDHRHRCWMLVMVLLLRKLHSTYL